MGALMILQVLAAIYLGGIVVGLAVMRDPWPVRLGTAMAWPLGLASLVVVAAVLLAAAAYLWPVAAALVLLMAAALWLAF